MLALAKSLGFSRNSIAIILGVKTDSIRYDDRMTFKAREFFIRLNHIYKLKGLEWFLIPQKILGMKTPKETIEHGGLNKVEDSITRNDK
jgi:deoxycytidine triphosphate deaminase